MKWLISLAVILTLANLVYAAEPVSTAPAATAAASVKAPSSASSNEVNVSFDDLLIQGKYHFSDEAVVTVEEDKVLDSLLGVRKDFKDRIQQSATR